MPSTSNRLKFPKLVGGGYDYKKADFCNYLMDICEKNRHVCHRDEFFLMVFSEHKAQSTHGGVS